MSEPCSPPRPRAIPIRLFDFKAHFSGDLGCLPMAVCRKLDLAGGKLKLVWWLEPPSRWVRGPGACLQETPPAAAFLAPKFSAVQTATGRHPGRRP